MAFVSVAILKDANQNKIISENSVDQFFNSLNTINKIMTEDAIKFREKKLNKKHFFEKYSHLRPGTYDLGSENYADNDFKILKDIAQKFKKNK